MQWQEARSQCVCMPMWSSSAAAPVTGRGWRSWGTCAGLATSRTWLWHEYECATRGHQCITWNKGLRQMLAAPDRTDDEIAAEEVGGEVLVLI